MKKVAIVVFLLASSSGCMEQQLRNKTVGLSATTTDLIYIQALDNVARTIDNPSEMPYFDVPANGTAQVQMSLSVTATPQWALATALKGAPFLFTQQAATFNPEQIDNESWQVTPMADPDRLVLMHCAYLRATGHATERSEMLLCEYYHARKAWVDKGIQQLESLDEKGKTAGSPSSKPPLPIHIPYCTFVQQGWYNVGRKCDVPRDACFVGSHGNTYVWVMPGQLDGLTMFALAILDFYNINNPGSGGATHTPATTLSN